MHGDAVIGGVPGAADIVGDHRIFDNDVAGVIILDKKDGRAVFVYFIVLDLSANNGQCHRVSVVVYCSSATAAGCSRICRIGAITNGAVIGKEAVDNGP